MRKIIKEKKFIEYETFNTLMDAFENLSELIMIWYRVNQYKIQGSTMFKSAINQS